jgi:putative oxidoreductase
MKRPGFPGLFIVRSTAPCSPTDPAPARDNALQQHCADGIIPLLLCDTPPISCRDMLSLEAATRYELDATNFGETIMIETLAAWTPRALSVLRIVAGLLIIQHGMGKIIGFPAFAAYAKVQPLSLIGAAGFIELIGGALLVLGLFTQPAAFILSGEMAVAYFMSHAPKDFFPLVNGGTLAIMYCFTFLYLATAGAGPWSLDATMKKN